MRKRKILTDSVISARKEMYTMLKDVLSNADEKTLQSMNRDLFGGHNRMADLGRGHSTIPVDRFEDVMMYCGIPKDSITYKKLLKLEKLSLSGYKASIKSFCDIYENNGNTENEEVKKTNTDVNVDKTQYRKHFAHLLTRWLFANGFNLRNAANRIGCSEQELKQVVNGDICLSPHHVARFRETLDMKPDIVKELSDIAKACYDKPAVSQDIIDYISSDTYILEVLKKAAKKDIPASKWKEFEETVDNDRSDRWRKRI